MSDTPAIRPRPWKSRLFWLMMSMLLLLLLYPYLDNRIVGPAVLSLLSSAVLLFGVYSVSEDRLRALVGVLLCVPAMLLSWAALLLPDPRIAVASDIVHIAFYGYVTVRLVRHISRETRVSADEIFGAASAYMLFGLFWASAYGLVAQLVPGAFTSSAPLTWSRLLYFSFSTLTTVGFGDIVPASAAAQSLATLEAIIGVLFTTIMVAWLVGQAISSAEERRMARLERDAAGK